MQQQFRPPSPVQYNDQNQKKTRSIAPQASHNTLGVKVLTSKILVVGKYYYLVT
jgi:hypothetical protein